MPALHNSDTDIQVLLNLTLFPYFLSLPFSITFLIVFSYYFLLTIASPPLRLYIPRWTSPPPSPRSALLWVTPHPLNNSFRHCFQSNMLCMCCSSLFYNPLLISHRSSTANIFSYFLGCLNNSPTSTM